MKALYVTITVLLLGAGVQAVPIVNNVGTTGEDSVTFVFHNPDSLGQPLGGLDTTKILILGPAGDSIFAEILAGVTGRVGRRSTGNGKYDTTYFYKPLVADVDGAGRAGTYTVRLTAVSNETGAWLRFTTIRQFQIVGIDFSDALDSIGVAARYSADSQIIDVSSAMTTGGLIPKVRDSVWRSTFAYSAGQYADSMRPSVHKSGLSTFAPATDSVMVDVSVAQTTSGLLPKIADTVWEAAHQTTRALKGTQTVTIPTVTSVTNGVTVTTNNDKTGYTTTAADKQAQADTVWGAAHLTTRALTGTQTVTIPTVTTLTNGVTLASGEYTKVKDTVWRSTFQYSAGQFADSLRPSLGKDGAGGVTLASGEYTKIKDTVWRSTFAYSNGEFADSVRPSVHKSGLSTFVPGTDSVIVDVSSARTTGGLLSQAADTVWEGAHQTTRALKGTQTVTIPTVTSVTNGVTIANDAITAATIAADAIGASELATSAIGSAELALGSITSSELDGSAVEEIVANVWNVDYDSTGWPTGSMGDSIPGALDLANRRLDSLAKLVRSGANFDSVGVRRWAGVLNDSITGGSLAVGDYTKIADSVWRRTFDPSPPAGSFADSAGGWGATSASSLDSGAVSRIVGRKVWGIADGSGADSSTIGQRKADTTLADAIRDSVNAVLDTLQNGSSTLRDGSLTALTDTVNAIIDTLQNHDNWVARADSLYAVLDTLQNNSSSLRVDTGSGGSCDLTAVLDSIIAVLDTLRDGANGPLVRATLAPGAITATEAPNLDAAISTRSTFAAATDSVLVDMSVFNATLDNDTTLVNFLRAGIGGGAGLWTAQQIDSVLQLLRSPVDTAVIRRWAGIIGDSTGSASVDYNVLADSVYYYVAKALYDSLVSLDSGMFILEYHEWAANNLILNPLFSNVDSTNLGFAPTHWTLATSDSGHFVTTRDSVGGGGILGRWCGLAYGDDSVGSADDTVSLSSYPVYLIPGVYRYGLWSKTTTRTDALAVVLLDSLGATVDSQAISVDTVWEMSARQYILSTPGRYRLNITAVLGDSASVHNVYLDGVFLSQVSDSGVASGGGGGGCGDGLDTLWLYAIDTSGVDTRVQGVTVQVANWSTNAEYAAQTNDSGYAEFFLDAGVTYSFWGRKPGYRFYEDTLTMIASFQKDTLFGYNYTGRPADSNAAMVRVCVKKNSGEPAVGIDVSAYLLTPRLADSSGAAVINRVQTKPTDSSGCVYFQCIWSSYLIPATNWRFSVTTPAGSKYIDVAVPRQATYDVEFTQ